MERFKADIWLQWAELFGFLEAGPKADSEDEVGDRIRERASRILGRLHEGLSVLGLTASTKSAGRAVVLLRSPECTWVSFIKITSELRSRMIDEMEDSLFLSVSPKVAILYTESSLFGDEVADKFPSSAFDIEEAGKCLALDRGTACVFHLMRVLEVGLYAMATQFNITPEENWHNVIEQIQSEVKVLAKTSVGSKSPWRSAWKDRVQFYSEAAAQFMYVKEAWRNRTAHLGQVYTLEKARSIFDHVCDFMKHLATELAEPS